MSSSRVFGLALFSIGTLSTATGCALAGASVRFAVGHEVTFSTSSLNFPAQLSSGSTVPTIPCPPADCSPIASVTFACRNSACDPDPIPTTTSSGDVDLAASAGEFAGTLRVAKSLEVSALTVNVSRNTLNTEIPTTDLLFGPAGSASAGSPGVSRLGTIAPIGPGQNGAVGVTVDQPGLAAFSSYVVNTSKTVRFFLRTAVDVDPNDPVPSGEASLAIRMEVTARTSL